MRWSCAPGAVIEVLVVHREAEERAHSWEMSFASLKEWVDSRLCHRPLEEGKSVGLGRAVADRAIPDRPGLGLGAADHRSPWGR